MADLEDDKGVPLWVRLCTPATCVWQGTSKFRNHGGHLVAALHRLYGASMVEYGEGWLGHPGVADYNRLGERLVVESLDDVVRIYDIGPRPTAEPFAAQRGSTLDISPARASPEATPPWMATDRKATLELVRERIRSGPCISLLMVNNVEAVVGVLCEQLDELWKVIDGAE